MNSTATTNTDGVPPVTALDLVNIASVLIDQQDVNDSTDPSTRLFRTGAKAGIVSMCRAATSAINAFGALSLTQQAGPAPADQHGDAQSNQGVAPQSGGPDQHSGASQPTGIIFSNRPHSSKILGEHCAGRIVDITTGVVYEVMVMPGELTCATWDEAKRTIQAAGGDLPTPVEMSMLAKLLGRIAFQESYWVNEKVKFDGDAKESISYFSDGIFDFSDAKDRMSARGVRRVCIGDAADANLDEVDDNTVIVPAPAQTSGNSGQSTVKLPDQLWQAVHAECAILESENVPAHFEAAGALRTSMSAFEEVIAIPTRGSGPDLSDRPDLQAMRAALFEDVEPVTMEAIAAVLDELNGIMDADDEGDTIQTLAPVIKVINGLMLIADPEKLVGAAVQA
jgi:hypothetical protein